MAQLGQPLYSLAVRRADQIVQALPTTQGEHFVLFLAWDARDTPDEEILLETDTVIMSTWHDSEPLEEVRFCVPSCATIPPRNAPLKRRSVGRHRQMADTSEKCLGCHEGTPTEGVRICPVCRHEFRGLAWEGIDAHWRSKHESLMRYEDFWTTLCRSHRSAKPPVVATTEHDLAREARELAKHIVGKTVRQVWRHRAGELCIEFTDGTRLFVDRAENGIELSIN